VTPFAVIVLAAVVATAVAVGASRFRQSRNSVDSFRRQIDALSPEARRPVVDQVQNAAAEAQDDSPEDDDTDGA
jgi:hypothetical protein